MYVFVQFQLGSSSTLRAAIEATRSSASTGISHGKAVTDDVIGDVIDGPDRIWILVTLSSVVPLIRR